MVGAVYGYGEAEVRAWSSDIRRVDERSPRRVELRDEALIESRGWRGLHRPRCGWEIGRFRVACNVSIAYCIDGDSVTSFTGRVAEWRYATEIG